MLYLAVFVGYSQKHHLVKPPSPETHYIPIPPEDTGIYAILPGSINYRLMKNHVH